MIYFWDTFHGNFICSQSFCQKSAVILFVLCFYVWHEVRTLSLRLKCSLILFVTLEVVMNKCDLIETKKGTVNPYKTRFSYNAKLKLQQPFFDTVLLQRSFCSTAYHNFLPHSLWMTLDMSAYLIASYDIDFCHLRALSQYIRVVGD